MNTSGLRLIELCSELDLIICNTFFREKIKHKDTWFHPRFKHGHMIDYIITRKRDSSDVCPGHVMCSTECGTEIQVVKAPKRIDVTKLKRADICEPRLLSEEIPIDNGVKQGDIPVPTFFLSILLLYLRRLSKIVMKVSICDSEPLEGFSIWEGSMPSQKLSKF